MDLESLLNNDEKQSPRGAPPTSVMDSPVFDNEPKERGREQGSAEDPLAVWLGSTVALAATTLIGVLAGQALLRYVSLQWIHRAGGILFVAFGLVATGELVSSVV